MPIAIAGYGRVIEANDSHPQIQFLIGPLVWLFADGAPPRRTLRDCHRGE
jgi:hypothetical protein